MDSRAFFAPRAMLERKPRHGSPCNRCGLCCVATLCELARHLFKKSAGPCPALLDNNDGTFSCGVVVKVESDALRQAALHLIGSAVGCDARFNGEWINHDFHKRQAEIDRKEMPKTESARALWGMERINGEV